MKVPRLLIWPFFKWYDFWIGVYIDTENDMLYICPIPMFGLKIHWIMEEV
jgi:hypothetical protein